MTQTTTSRRAEILVLDDEQPLAEMLGELLKMRGYAATLCGSGSEAIDLLERCEFDLVISDLRMPEMSGRDFYHLAVSKKPELARRIIFITGDVVGEEFQSFLQTTGNPHLSKPFKLAAVEKVIADTLRRTVST
jgi:CheY-like chemotaxis protein